MRIDAKNECGGLDHTRSHAPTIEFDDEDWRSRFAKQFIGPPP